MCVTERENEGERVRVLERWRESECEKQMKIEYVCVGERMSSGHEVNQTEKEVQIKKCTYLHKIGVV